ncbi:MAG: hypothetical protein PHW52_00800 [Candidatus Pacebacteria bacterium]|nr:hypothetical protein [Candidatus Paceibacterota bacterium]
MEKWLEFILTNLSIMVIELPILFIIGKFILKDRYESDTIIFSGAIATMMSTPYLWYVCPLFFNVSSPYYLYFSQAIVILVESIVFCNALRMQISKALLISAVINIASYLLYSKVLAFIVVKM